MDQSNSSNANFISESMLAEEEEKNKIGQENENDTYYIGRNESSYMDKNQQISADNIDDGEVGDDADEIILNQ